MSLSLPTCMSCLWLLVRSWPSAVTNGLVYAWNKWGWKGVGYWLFALYPLGWFSLLYIVWGPETGAGRALVAVVWWIFEGFKCGMSIVFELTQRSWLACQMRPRSPNQFAAAWRYQRLKAEHSALRRLVAQYAADISTASSRLAASEVSLRTAQEVDYAPWYISARVDPAWTANAGFCALQTLVKLWRDIMKLPAGELRGLATALCRRHPHRELSAVELDQARSTGQWADIGTHRLIRQITLAFRRKGDANTTIVDRLGLFIGFFGPSLADTYAEVIGATFFGCDMGPRVFMWYFFRLPVRYIFRRAWRYHRASRLQPNEDYDDRLLRAIQAIASSDFAQYEFDKVAVAAYNLQLAQDEYARCETDLHNAILGAVLVCHDLERRTTELRLAFLDYKRECSRNKREAGSLRRSD